MKKKRRIYLSDPVLTGLGIGTTYLVLDYYEINATGNNPWVGIGYIIFLFVLFKLYNIADNKK